jgi:hypothetical protein
MKGRTFTVAVAPILALALGTGVAHADDVGVTGRKLIVVDKIVAANKAKLVYVSKGDPNIHKGPGAPDFKNGPQLVTGQFDVFYTDNASIAGSFIMPAEWKINKDDKVAKFVNKDAPGGVSEVKVAVVKPTKVAKVVAKGLGGLDLFMGAPSDANGITTVLTIDNQVDSSQHRMCTRFSVADGSVVVFKEIAGGTGRKLVAKNGVPVTCPSGGSPTGTIFAFTTAPAGGVCGEARAGGSGGSVVNTLTCGDLNIGAGAGTVPAGPTPDGALTRFATTCGGGGSCTVAETPFDGTNSCSDTGCPFGPPLSIANGPLSTCVSNTFASPASGSLNTNFGTFTGAVPLSSSTTVTGNNAEPCPPCSAGSCDASAANPGAACAAINASLDAYECLPNGSTLPSFAVNLAPTSTGTEILVGSTPCPGQTSPGCFGDNTCDYIEVRGTPAGALTPGAKPIGLASAFCIPATGNVLIDGAADLPGPGAVTLPGSAELL